ncbi:hypothetical protein DMP23_05070 [Amycolatopsis sp. A1MSW2902]
MALGALDAPNAALGACDAPNAALGALRSVKGSLRESRSVKGALTYFGGREGNPGESGFVRVPLTASGAGACCQPRRVRTAVARVSSRSAVVSQSMQASVIDWP